MKTFSLKMFKTNKLLEVLATLLLLVSFVLPFLSFAKGGQDIYVNVAATGKEDGSAAAPFHTIKAALNVAGENDKLHLSNGTYHENIKIPNRVSVFGESRSGVIIEAASNNKAAVTMQDGTRLDKVTVRFGENGIKIEGEDKVSVVNVIVEKSKHDGISIEDAKVNKSNLVGITDSIIRKNDRAGIFSQKRKLSLINNEVVDNDKDGVVLQSGVDAWIKGNKLENNDGVGLRAELDNSNIWAIKNSYKQNEKGGVIVDAFGEGGRMDIAKSKFTDNGGYGVVRLSHGSISRSVWNGLTINSNNAFKDSEKGNVSPIIVK